jgi:hypothetical protein
MRRRGTFGPDRGCTPFAFWAISGNTILKPGEHAMSFSTLDPQPIQVWRPCARAFFVYYVAMAIFFFGPLINPEAWLSPRWGLILGLMVMAAVAYQWNQEYHITQEGLSKIWRWPQRRHDIPWESVGEVVVRRGLTQTLLRVGNVFIKDNTGGPAMFWFGLDDPKEVKDIIESRRP